MRPVIDISHHQNPDSINYDLLSENISGVIIRLAYGSRPDVHANRHYNEFKSREVPIGFYQFVTQYMTVQSQVDTLKMMIAGRQQQLGFWADIEREGGADPLLKQQVHNYMQQVELQVTPIEGIYTSAYYWHMIMGGAYYTNKKLWVAGYVKDIYDYMPIGWDDYWLWQYTSSAKFPGYSGNLDASYFRYDEQTFNQWAGIELPDLPEPVEPPPPPEPTPPPLTELYRPCDTWAYITQRFGANPSWYPTSKGHNGVDFGFNYTIGNPIYAAADGVVEVSRDEKTGYGRHIRIRHSHGVTIYGHLSQRKVVVGDTVNAMQIIGLSGGNIEDPYAGFSTGPHLHFEYRWDIPAPQVPGGFVYNAVDPLPLIVEHNQGENMLYRIEVTAYALNIRNGIGTSASVLYAVPKGTILEVFEETNGWVRVGVGKWCSGSPLYVKKLAEAPPTDPSYTTEEKVEILWGAHPELHD